MNIELNGEQMCVKSGLNIEGLLDVVGFSNRPVAVEVNAQVIPRSKHAQCQLNERDKIEIIQAIGGG